MEFPQSIALGNEGRNSTCEFMSLYSAVERDSRPPPGCLKTHDFLRPLDNCKKEERRNELHRDEQLVVLPSSSHNSFPNTSHISLLSQTLKNTQKNGESFIQLPERDEETSNCSSFSGSGFVLWEDSSVRKENTVSGKMGQWTAHNSSNRCVDFNSVSSSMSSGKNNLCFMNYGSERHVIKKEASSFGEELSVQLDRRCKEQKANTPRSKHSATEQRRRSKINDRFLMLRDLIPHGDQKRDKASFLLEVIEYIQLLKEKLGKYEGSYEQVRAMKEACIPIPISSADKLPAKEQEMLIEGGTINISSPYSQGLLNSLTLALQKSGVDLSQASISVQVDLGNRSDGTRDMEIQPGRMAVSRVPCPERSQKRLKMMSRKHA